MTKVFFQHSQGAVVFWGPRHPPSLAEAVKWRTKINQEVRSPIPCVLVTENVMDSCANSVKWIGPGNIFESELALDQFCKDHRFAGHFEITSRDWESGEKSVFGQAVNRLLDEILQGDEKEDNTRIWRDFRSTIIQLVRINDKAICSLTCCQHQSRMWLMWQN